jgi:drug/metabolite transporter (DMT)-like permease
MSIRPRLQIGIVDIFLVTTLLAGIVSAIATGELDIAFIVASCLGAFIWHRPVVSTLWVTGMIGLGAGLFTAGWHGQHHLHMQNGDMVGWGAGMLVGGFTYLVKTTRLRNMLAQEANRNQT